eukprot:1159638-Pelagomonas_calceolata.AAC.1
MLRARALHPHFSHPHTGKSTQAQARTHHLLSDTPRASRPLPCMLCTFWCVQEIGSPEKIIKGFAPELYKEPLEDDAVLEQSVEQHDGLDYYYWCVCVCVPCAVCPTMAYSPEVKRSRRPSAKTTAASLKVRAVFHNVLDYCCCCECALLPHAMKLSLFCGAPHESACIGKISGLWVSRAAQAPQALQAGGSYGCNGWAFQVLTVTAYLLGECL